MLTKYEVSRLVGIRANQLAMGAEPKVKVDASKSYNYLLIAALEVQNKTLFASVRRCHPDGPFQDVDIRTLSLPNDMVMLVKLLEDAS